MARPEAGRYRVTQGKKRLAMSSKEKKKDELKKE